MPHAVLDKRTGLPLKSRIDNGNGSVVSMSVFRNPDRQGARRQLFRNDMTATHPESQPRQPCRGGLERGRRRVRAGTGGSATLPETAPSPIWFSDGLSVL